VLLPEQDAAHAVEAVERLRRAVETLVVPAPSDSPGGATAVTLSAGVASYTPGQAVAAESLVTEADLALYRSKENGRNRTTASV
jgi:diguanylate cyclase (GGDEF)-like protein